MPIYEYDCKKCGIRFETIQHVPGEDYVNCPECGEFVKKIISKTNIAHIASGFTDVDEISDQNMNPINPKKQDIFGRHKDHDLPDEEVHQRRYWEWEEEVEKRKGPPREEVKSYQIDRITRGLKPDPMVE